MATDHPTLPPPLAAVQFDDARDAYASAVIEGTGMSEERALEIAHEFYASDVPERVAALPPMADMSYEEMTDTLRQAGLLKG